MTENIGTESGLNQEYIRMTTPRNWPNNAGEARDRAAEASVAGLRALKPIITGMHITEADLMRRVAIASVNLQHIARMMESMGAPTEPISEDFWKEE